METTIVNDPVIIAMKGLPYTAKSTIARSLAKFFRYAVIDHDSVRHVIASFHESVPPQHLDNLSFDAICRVIVHQQKFRLSVIVDSPLSSQAHLDRLSQISTSSGYKLVIIECKCRDKFIWRQRLEQRCDDTDVSTYKPSTWDDLVDLIQIHDGCSSLDTGNLPKIAIDTTGHVEVSELAFTIQTLASAPENQANPIYYHDYVSKLRRDLVITRGDKVKDENEREIQDQKTNGHLHVLEFSNSVGVDKCRACLEPVSGSAYICKACNLTLHKSCAELPHRSQINPEDVPNFLQGTPQQYSFPEIVNCNHCEFHNEKCHECLFESYVRLGSLPSVLNHPTHKHPLCVKIVPVSDLYESGYQCKACGELGKYISYYCYECDFECHLNCGLLPHTGKEEHHLHRLAITSLPPEDEFMEYLCDACETFRNPNHWIYYCAKCEFASHLSCMNFNKE